MPSLTSVAPLATTLAFCLPALLAAQAPARAGAEGYRRPSVEVRRAAETISVEYLRRGVFTIAHDSMLGRDTPSRGLELTAGFIAAEFERAGLQPGGDDGGWQQRYPLYLQRTLVAESKVEFSTPGGPTLSFPFSASALRRFGGSTEPLSGSVVLIGGPVDTIALAATPLANRVVVWPAAMPTGANPAGLQPVMRALARGGAVALVLISNRADGAPFARAVANQARPSASRDSVGAATGGVLVVEIPEAALAGQLPEAAEQLAGVRQSPAFVVQDMPEWSGTVDLRRVSERSSAPNTVGILEGTDPALRSEYVVVSAHMDHVGSAGAPPDSIFNGADDDASGTIGIVAMARAFAQPGARPRRSMIFVTVSGEEKGLWGSAWFADHPPVPVERMVANINMDMIGRNWPDTIVVIGKEHSDLGQTLHAVSAAHPELRMAPIDDLWPQQSFYTRSDHFNFARKGVPILFFFNGTHEDYHRASDSPDKINYEKMSRVARLGFYLGTAIANRTERPQWDPESYKRILQPRTP
jgi:hypothetical protein